MEQLRDLLEHHHVANRLLLKSIICSQEDYIAILSGNSMHNLVRGGVVCDDEFTVLWNMDGAQAFRSSIFAYWSCFLTVSELSYVDRKQNVLMW